MGVGSMLEITMLGSPPQLPARQTPGAGGQQYLDSGPLVLHGWRTPARRLMSAAGATAARQDERSIHRHQQQRLAGRRQQRSPVVRGRVRRRPGTIEVPKPTGVPLTSPQARCLLENPKMMVGWEVMLASGGATSGRVRSVSGSQQTATLLKVYGPGWGCKAGPGKGCTSESSSVHLIPFADNIVQRVDLAGKRLVIQPPEGLLELSQRRMLLKWLDPQLEELAVKLVPNHSCPAGRGRPFMPTREQLKASGHGHLVSAIQAAGGFLEVAYELNFRHRRKPSGYWDNIDTLDQEISRFVASNWVQLSDTDSDTIYFYNQITGRVVEQEPKLPLVEMSEDGMVWVIREDPNDRVMPSIREVCSAGRYDLHHGILYNGGYRLVARELYRPPSYPRVRPKSLEELAAELQAIMEEEELGDRVPTPSLLYDIGKHHLLKAVLDFGGFPTVVERIAKDLGIDMRTRRRAGHWDDISNVVKEMREFMKQQSEEGEEPQLLPTHRELVSAGRADLRYALQKHGHRQIASMLGVRENPRGRPRRVAQGCCRDDEAGREATRAGEAVAQAS